MATTSQYGFVTKHTDTDWVAKPIAGQTVGHGKTLREAQRIIESAMTGPSKLRWIRYPDSTGVECWAAGGPEFTPNMKTAVPNEKTPLNMTTLTNAGLSMKMGIAPVGP